MSAPSINDVSEFIAYIDEAGDEGLGKLREAGFTGQSKWLALGAAVVTKEHDPQMPTWRDEILKLFPMKKTRDLHFRNLNHDQAVAACQLIVKKPIGICVVASNKITLLDSPKLEVFKNPGHLYNYLIRFLLERITTAIAKKVQKTESKRGRLHIVFSRRPNTDYQSMKEYLCLMRDGKEVIEPVRSILWEYLDPEDIKVQNHANRAGLQIADIVTSATTAALEPNGFGFCEPRYALTLKEHYLRHNKCILNCGLTLIPPAHKSPLTDEHKKFLNDLEKK